MNPIDQTNLEKAASMYPSKAIRFASGFIEVSKPFGFVPHDWDGKESINFYYQKPNLKEY